MMRPAARATACAMRVERGLRNGRVTKASYSVMVGIKHRLEPSGSGGCPAFRVEHHGVMV